VELARRFGYRFLCAYLLLYNFPTPGQVSISASSPNRQTPVWYSDMWAKLDPWISMWIFHVKPEAAISIQKRSGDQTTRLCPRVFVARYLG